MIEYLLKDDILLINRENIKRFGGNFVEPENLLDGQALDYLLEAVQSKVFGEELYPKLFQKAGLYMFNIIDNHIFQDGNKRTGLEAALLFLRLNNKNLKNSLSKVDSQGKMIPQNGNLTNEILFEFTMEIASGKLTLEEVQLWFKQNIK